VLVHRKGAAPAHAGAAGMIPGSAGTMSVHVEGRGEARSLCTSSHGAGRLLSRSDAKRVVSARDVVREMAGVVFDERRVHGLRDESPSVYRDLREVMRAQRELVKTTRTLRPVVSFKAAG
jgi:tRNA-splicing ligase RtcB